MVLMCLTTEVGITTTPFSGTYCRTKEVDFLQEKELVLFTNTLVGQIVPIGVKHFSKQTKILFWIINIYLGYN